VSREFPSSLPPPSSTPLTVRDSRDTIHNHQHSSVPIHPHHLPFGDPLPSPKPDSTFRVGFCNVGGFPAIAHHNEKVSDIKHFIVASELDLFGGCESNLNWKCLPDHLQLREWFRSADGCRSFATNNIHEKFGKFQYGGTFWIAAGHATGQITHSDKDPLNLGRWVSCSLQGRAGKVLTIIFAYRPCSNVASRIKSVHAQHCRYFDTINRRSCPRSAFLEDLASFISSRRDAGEAILVLGDMNGDIRHHTLRTLMSDVDLHELILSRFPTLPPPATFKRGERFGKTPIDGAWATDDVSISAASWRSVDHSPGDHRAIVIDINLVDCIGEPRYTIVRPPGRRLNSALPVTRRKYLQALQQHAENHHLAQKLDHLFVLASSPSTSRHSLLLALESFDKVKTEGMKHAEHHCRKLNMGLLHFSPELNLWRKRRLLWKLVLRRLSGHGTKARYINRLARSCKVFQPLSFSPAQAQAQFQAADQMYSRLKPKHVLLRTEFLASRLTDPSLSEEHHKAIGRLVSLEALRDTYRRIRAIKKASAGRSISAVETTTPTGTEVATTRAAVEATLSASLQKRFTRAHGSPFLKPPLAPLVGAFGTGTAAQAILEGTFTCPPGLDEHTRYFIEALKFPSAEARQSTVSLLLRPEDFIAHWKRAKEKTSSSPSGLHFGHYKSATYSLPLAHLHARFTQLIFQTGLSISRFQAGLQVILEKKAGNIHIDNLRAILLMEGDFNAAMKIFIGARLVNNALSLNLIPDECYGSRPGCTAIQLSLDRTLTADITRQSRASLAVASVDCLTCYDSVGHPPASIACQRLGSPQSLLETTFDTIQNMQISLRTAFGDSSFAYGGSASADLPFQGVCQGNGAGPALWLATSIPLIETLRHHGYVSKFSCPISGRSTSLTGMIYVNDCDLIAFFPPSSAPQEAVSALQHNVLLWQGCLKATGGSLSLKKCSWGLLSFFRKGNRWLPHNDLSAPHEIFILDDLGQPTPIRRIRPQDGSAVVGVTQSLIGDSTPALAALRQKADQWQDVLKSNFLPRSLMWRTLTQVLWPSLRYSLGITTFSPSQAALVVSRLYQTLLPRLGVNRHFPMALRFALPKYQGLGLPNPFWEQGISALSLFLEHANTSSKESVLIHASLELLHLELGIVSNLFDLPYEKWAFLATDCWIKSLWRFVASSNITLTPAAPILPPMQRTADGSIMEMVIHAHLPKATVLAINRCRIAHKAIYWSDVANGWGDRISPAMVSPPVGPSRSAWAWPPEHPTKADWAIWAAFLNNSPRTISGTVAPSLGSWLRTSHRLDVLPFDEASLTAFQPGHEAYWRLFSAASPRPYRSTRVFTLRGLSVLPPSASHRTRIEISSEQTLVLSGHAPYSPPESSPATPWPLRSAHFPESAVSIAQAISAGTAVAICDGSYMPNRYSHLAAAAWIIHPGPNNSALPCYGVTQVHGAPPSVNSYRAELQGLHALLLAIQHICRTHHLTSGSLVIGCDNQGVLHHVQHLRPYIPSLFKHADLLRAITTLCRQCPLVLSFQYVAGHQDELSRFDDLPLLAKLNVQADSLAKQALHVLGSQSAPPLLSPLPGLAWTLAIESAPLSSHLRPSLLDHLSYTEATHYWIQKEQLTPQTVTQIDWSLLGTALRSCPPTYSMWLAKFASGHSAVGTTMARWKKWDSPRCPMCHTVDETTCHVLQCPDPIRTSKWTQTIDELQSWLVQSDTNPDIIRCLTCTLRNRGTSTFVGAARDSCRVAAQDQDSIGFFGTMVGRLSPQWALSQAHYWRTNLCLKSPKHWAGQLCQRLLQATHATWLFRNQQIQSNLLETQTQDVLTAIRREFEIGHQNLLPTDHFYLSRELDVEGFSLQHVLDLPLPDQQLWLHAVQQARARGSRVLALETARMQSSLYTWLHPNNPSDT